MPHCISSTPPNLPGARRRRLTALLALALTGSQLACATGTEKLVRGGVEGGLRGTLEALNDPHNQELMRRLMQDADIQKSAHDLTEAITGGAVDGLTEAERMKRVREASDAYIRTISAAVGKALNEDISPAVTRGIGDVVGGTVASALRPENRQLARSFVDSVTRSTITAFTQSTAQGLRDDLGPALNKVLAQDLGPGLQRVIEDNLGPALRTVMERDLQPMVEAALGGEDGGGTGIFARALTRQIVLGVNDGMSDLGISLSPNRKDGLGLIGWLPIVLGVLLLLLTIAIARMIMTRRALAADRARSEEMLVNILRAIKTGEDEDGTGAAPELNAVIARARQSLPNLATNDSYLADIITRANLPTATQPKKAPRKLARMYAERVGSQSEPPSEPPKS